MPRRQHRGCAGRLYCMSCVHLDLHGRKEQYSHGTKVICLLQAVNPPFFFLFAAGWWLVENADKQIAWFPASYLEEIDVHRDTPNALSSNEEGKSVSDPRDTTFLSRNYEFCEKLTALTAAWISGAVTPLSASANHCRDTSSAALAPPLCHRDGDVFSAQQTQLPLSLQAACSSSCGPTRLRKQTSSR